MKKYKIVEVEWIDAQTGFGIPETVEECIEREPAITYSVGYLLHEDKENIILGFMLISDDMVKHSQLIPKGMIKKIKEIHKKGRENDNKTKTNYR